MPTFPKGHNCRNTFRNNERIARGASIQTSLGTITWIINPVDLRGIPAIGRSVTGAIRGSSPHIDGIPDSP